jgi:hypothetical protein
MSESLTNSLVPDATKVEDLIDQEDALLDRAVEQWVLARNAHVDGDVNAEREYRRRGDELANRAYKVASRRRLARMEEAS